MEGEDKQGVFANFQAATNLDIGECVAMLESHNWDFASAVQSFMASQDFSASAGVAQPTDTAVGTPASVPSTLEDFEDKDAVNLAVEGVGVRGSTSAAGTTAIAERTRSQYRLLTFNVEYRDQDIELAVSDQERVGKIKEILSDRLGIPSDEMQIRGIAKGPGDTAKLSELNLPSENQIYLLTPNVSNPTCSRANHRNDTDFGNFKLHITFTGDNRTYRLTFPGNKTIEAVKRDLFCLIDVPVRNQMWTGWTPGADSDWTLLKDAGLSQPIHATTVSRRITSNDQNKPSAAAAADCSSDEDMDTWEDAAGSQDADDHMFAADEPTLNTREPLVPENFDTEEEAQRNLERVFAARYGPIHPCFYIGSLADAVKDSVQCDVADRKLLALYLHHDQSILVNIFCSNVLCSRSVVEFLALNCVFWAWDLSREPSRAHLMTEVKRLFGSVAADTVRKFPLTELPRVLIISRHKGNNEIAETITGNATSDEFISQISNVMEMFALKKEEDARDERERAARDYIKREQDDAFRVSLAADQAKAEQRQQEEDQEQRQVEQMSRLAEEARLRLLTEQHAKQAMEESLREMLPDEPAAAGSGAPLACLRFRCPDGSQHTRRFLAAHTLDNLLTYVGSLGYPADKYKILTTYPRRDISQLEEKATMEDMKLCPQETLMLEERN